MLCLATINVLSDTFSQSCYNINFEAGSGLTRDNITLINWVCSRLAVFDFTVVSPLNQALIIHLGTACQQTFPPKCSGMLSRFVSQLVAVESYGAWDCEA